MVAEFRKHFYDTQLFFDPFAGGKFAQYLFRAHEEREQGPRRKDAVHQLIEEATLFIDAAHQCYTRLGSALRNPTPNAGGLTHGRTQAAAEDLPDARDRRAR